MTSRCYCASDSAFKDYGLKGIGICSRWRDSFENFLADMGECPPGMTLERIKGAENYSPENCRWATRKEQARNRSSNRHLTFRGQTKLMIEWSEALGIPMKYIHKRLARGWTVERALSEPVRGLGQWQRKQR
jgi:hypothetical protein